ncbi:PLDc N-terminal domain-containing protein [Desulfosediminicola sp.]|uniref:PLDc N-terminal domain-containing protein n=1 Tax=Desulfosediminicola sp. TaxID=2886825 RepID=UPI003AF1F558
MDSGMSGILGLLVLIADIWAIVNIVKSGATAGMKILWVLLVLILPVIGLLIWFFFGPKSMAAR